MKIWIWAFLFHYNCIHTLKWIALWQFWIFGWNC